MKPGGRASRRDGSASPDAPRGRRAAVLKTAAATLAAAAIALALVASFHFVRSRPASPLKEGDPAPDLDLAALKFDGRITLAELKGHPVVLGVLDTRWPAFLDAAEGLERLNRALGRRGLVVVGVFLDADAQAARDFVRSQPVTFTPVHDPDARALGPRYGRPLAPELVIIDAGGKVVTRSTDVAAWRTAPFRKTLEPFVEPEKPGS